MSGSSWISSSFPGASSPAPPSGRELPTERDPLSSWRPKDAASIDGGSSEEKSRYTACSPCRNSAVLTSGIIIADVVGAGILSMGVAVADFGWLLGAVVTILLLAMNVHISILMWRVRMACPGVKTFCQLAEAVFEGAPAGQRQAMVYLTGFTQYSFLFALLGLYTLSCGRGLGMIFYDRRVCLMIWCAIGCAILVPFHTTARQLGSYKSLIWINCATIVGSVFIPLIYMATQSLEQTRPPGSQFLAVAPLTIPNMLHGVSLMCFAFSSQFMVVEIMGEMSDVTEFPKAYCWFAAPFQGIAFLIAGVGGYYFSGSAVHGMTVDNIPFGPVLRIACVCLIAHMIITFLLKGIVFCRAVHKSIDRESYKSDGAAAWSKWTMIVLTVITCSWVISQIVPFFSDFVDLLGASCTPVGCYIIPIVLYARMERDGRVPPREDSKNANLLRYIEWGVIALELLVSVVLCIFGTIEAVRKIVLSWDEYGMPFDCHCQGMWNTCACSDTHIGMADQCPALALLNYARTPF